MKSLVYLRDDQGLIQAQEWDEDGFTKGGAFRLRPIMSELDLRNLIIGEIEGYTDTGSICTCHWCVKDLTKHLIKVVKTHIQEGGQK